MPAGKHRGVRVALSVPPGIHNQLDQWAEAEGRPIASLCMSIIESALRDAVAQGIAPSIAQTKVNDPLLDTKPGVVARRLQPEEVAEIEKAVGGLTKVESIENKGNGRPGFTATIMNRIANKKLEEQVNPDVVDPMDLPKEDRQKLALQLLDSLKSS